MNRYRLTGLESLLAAGSADILMPDMQRVGGVHGWQAIAAVAARASVPVTPHLIPEIGVHLVTATPGATWVEWMPWAEPLLTDPLLIRAGMVYVPERPGAGMDFEPRAVARFMIE